MKKIKGNLTFEGELKVNGDLHVNKILVDKDAQKITYNELKDLRDNSQLSPGQQYRIIDYITTTAQSNTTSANHQFDIIVIADDEKTLNENARAILHEGDIYFANCNLEAWQLKYCIDNDTDRFAWADTTDGKGVIYFMRDEFNNECPYDFKNIIYEVRNSFVYRQWGDSSTFIRDSSLDSNGYYGWISDKFPPAWSNKYCFTVVETATTDMTLYSDTNGTTISYGGSIISVENKEYDSYTFNYISSNINYDASIEGRTKFCYNNVIKGYYNSNKLQLNWNIFYSTSIDFNCYSNTFGGSCHHNIFGYYCHTNIFGNGCFNNTFGNNCYSNIFGNECYRNAFGGLFRYNTFGNYCSNNIFGDECYENTFGNGCHTNTFGDNCDSNTFGNSCQANNFGNYCYENTFGNGCYENTFGDSSGTINYCRYNIIDEGCSYLYINSVNSPGTNPSYTYSLQNIHIHLGVKGSSEDSRLTITVDRNLEYSTTILAPGSKEIILDEE